MAIIAKFTRTLPAPTATISGGFVFLLSAGWFTQANTGAAGSPIDGGTNSIANGGGDMQIFSDTGTTTRLPIEVVTFVTGGIPQCQVWVRTPSYTAGDTITIGKDDAQTTQPAVGAAFGRNATWVDYAIAFHGDSISDSTGNTTPTITSATSGAVGKIGAAYSFNGASSRIDFLLPLPVVDKFTIKVWANPLSNASAKTIAGLADKDVSNNQDRINQESNTATVNTFGGSSALLSAPAVAAQYNLYVYALDQSLGSNQAKLYINGALADEGAGAGSVSAFDRLTLGVTADSTPVQWFGGEIDDVIFSLSVDSPAKLSSEYINQNDPGNFGTSSEYILVGGSGISLTVTEVLNSFADTSNINIDYNVIATITETLNSFGDSSAISVTSGQVVDLTVTETLSAFTDASNVNVSVNVDVLVTEVLNSFLDGANVTIAKDITLQVTETLNAFADNSSVRLPANWIDKIKVTTTYTTQTPTSTTWIDKG